MKARMCGALLALLVTASNAAVEEDVHSTHSMLPFCKLSSKQTVANVRNALLYGECFGMVSGVVAMIEVLRQARASGKAQLDPVLCAEIPTATTIEQLVNTAVRYGETHPNLGHERLEVVAFMALRDTWPCNN